MLMNEQWAYNVIRGLERDREDPECLLLGQMLTGALGQHFIMCRCEFWEEMAETFADMATIISSPEQPMDCIEFVDIAKHLGVVFPSKPQENIYVLEQLLTHQRFSKESLLVSRISAQQPTVAESELMQLLWSQCMEEIAAYETQLRNSLLDSALQYRRARPQGLATLVGVEKHTIKPDDLRTKLKLLEPNKCPEDVACAVYRAFSFASFQDTLAAIQPQESFAEEESGDQGTYRAAMFTSQEAVDVVLVRLGCAGLLRPTLPDDYGMSTGSVSSKLQLQRIRRKNCRLDALKGTTPGSPELGQSWQEASTTRIVANGAQLELPMHAAVLKQEKGREKAVTAALQSCTEKAIPQWAKVPYIPDPLFSHDSKSFLEQIIIQYQQTVGTHSGVV